MPNAKRRMPNAELRMPNAECRMLNAKRRTTNSGAFENLQGSWNNASQIFDLGGISGHPNDPSKYCVISFTQGSAHTVQVFESGCIKSDNQCYLFSSVSTCVHSPDVSKWLGTLENCAVPENVHSPPTEGIGISWGVGVLQGQKM